MRAYHYLHAGQRAASRYAAGGMQQALPEENELMPELPPLDEGDDSEGPAGDPDDLVVPLDEPANLDDESEIALDVGVELDEPRGDEGSDEEAGELVLDIAALLDAVDENETGADGDAVGPERFDTTSGIAELPEESVRDAEARPMDVALDELVDGELPELDDDGEGEAGEDADATWLELPAEADVDEPPPWAAERWSLVSLADEPGAMRALDLCDATLIAAGQAILIQEPGATRLRRIETGARRIESIALVPGRGAAICATEGGELERIDLHDGTWTPLQGFTGTAPGPVVLGRSGSAIIARTAAGFLFASRDAGASFTSIDVRVRVVALGGSAAPLVALARDRLGPKLFCTEDGGASWQQVALDPIGRLFAGADFPRIAARGNVIAVSDPSLGIAVSADRGESFTRVPGTPAVTALCIGELMGRPHVFAARLAELEGATHILGTDVTTMTTRVVAAIEGDSVDEATLERVAVDSLIWDGPRARLIAASEAGLFAWHPPAGNGNA